MALEAERMSSVRTGIKRSDAEAKKFANEFACEIALAKASELAYDGFLDESETIVVEVLRRAESAQALDLLARILYLQNRLPEAELFWRKASEISPDNELFNRALNRVQRELRHPYLYSNYTWLSLGAVGLLLTIVLASFIVFRHFQAPSPPSILANGSNSLTTPSPVASQPYKKLALNLSGISTRIDGSETVVTFDSGLFQQANEFKPGATKVLEDLAHQLESDAAQLSIRVIGRTDKLTLRNHSSFPDNQSIALARALKVAEFLRTATPLRAASFAIMGAGERSSDYTSGTSGPAAKERTVEMRISRVGR